MKVLIEKIKKRAEPYKRKPKPTQSATEMTTTEPHNRTQSLADDTHADSTQNYPQNSALQTKQHPNDNLAYVSL